MSKVGTIPIFSLLVLLVGGCSHYYCPTPDKPSFTGYTCWWEVMVKDMDPKRDEVTGTLAGKGDQLYTFRVRHVDKLEQAKQLEKEKKYLFNNGHSSPYLEPFAEGSTYRNDDSHMHEVKEVQ